MVLESGTEKVALALGLIPAAIVLSFAFFVAKSPKERKHKLYHVSGEWAIRFLWLSLAVLPFVDLTNNAQLAALEYLFGVLSEFYVSIHAVTYLKYTLSRDGLSVNVFFRHLKERDYLIWGVLGSSCGILFAFTFSRFVLYGACLFGSYHIMTRDWDRKRKGKSAVEGAAIVPYVTGLLLAYQVYRKIF